jgi:hypothetical protein
MTRHGQSLVRAGVLALCGVLPACSKSSDSAQRSPSSARVLPGAAPMQPEDPAGFAPGDLPRAPGHDPIVWDGAPLAYTVTQTLEAAAPTVDPDLAVVEAARASASECFGGLTSGPDVRSAVINVTVVPSGSVSRSEVSSDPDVADCLRRVGEGLHFSEKDDRPGPAGSRGGGDNGGAGIRSFSIAVSVTRNH